ncbi:methylated-DNA--[protein]-cysteine S-methyltransferase [Pseudoprimorskyibacter insulae]|uniref:Methylated-DNA--protein-cysteine methyltransferase n=1 Tax=Pseudoprimorskyibacter insulae TaxID=1695997 RepID=A0A2R8AV93_9RHOB|nr:methylated-DNA--[protein]-cysteine S-methyltransferase [Pseudoprimorskyibacter insulae]SPF79951.1 Methylated-DNA--protein-cysteine methyltransferase, constitutive [Pseudoprimorskyibacter insulae]
MPSLTTNSPLGPLTLAETNGAITRLTWGTAPNDPTPLLTEAAAQLDAYFNGQRTSFDLPLAPHGSDLQIATCQAMCAIPFGETRTYGDLAKALGKPAQAIGQACGGNPIPILIPCHRVLSATGLGGFSGGTGIETKIWLLKHEGAASLLI